MTRLDFNACGVQEMNRQEMVEVNGGGLLSKIVKTVRQIIASFCTPTSTPLI